LKQSEIRQIADIQLGMLRKRMAGAGLGLEITDAGLDLLAEAGFDPVYGARPLKRAIQQQIENPLAQAILSGEFSSGETVKVDVEDGVFRFRH
jgi:ATP-dependent Clp protease ATP-binding subunit ClpB